MDTAVFSESNASEQLGLLSTDTDVEVAHQESYSGRIAIIINCIIWLLIYIVGDLLQPAQLHELLEEESKNNIISMLTCNANDIVSELVRIIRHVGAYLSTFSIFQKWS